jgi:signal transduction histidine kinase
VLDIPPALPAVLAPEELIEAVLTALLENSRQAGAPLASIAARADGSTVTLTVSDDGPGIPESDRERVFEPFFTGRRDSGGTGLGLAIVRSLLSSVNGTVEAMPITRGASFRVRLPKFEGGKRMSHCNDLQDGSG